MRLHINFCSYCCSFTSRWSSTGGQRWFVSTLLSLTVSNWRNITELLILGKVDKNPRWSWNKIDESCRKRPLLSAPRIWKHPRRETQNILTSVSFPCLFCFLKRFMINMIAPDLDKYLFMLCVFFQGLFLESCRLSLGLSVSRLRGLFPRRQINTAVTFLHLHYDA